MHGGLALAAGIVILLFPRIFFYLIGGFLLLSGAVAFFYGDGAVLGAVLAVAGIVILIFPKLVARLVAVYLLIFGLFLFFTGVFWFAAIPVVLVGIIVLVVPNIIAYLVGGMLAIGGGLTLFLTFWGVKLGGHRQATWARVKRFDPAGLHTAQ